MAFLVGVDIGGTFADFVTFDSQTGSFDTLKVLTTPTEPGRDIAEGLMRLEAAGLSPARIERFVHGTTVGVNTIIQRRGAKLALFTTAGFTDILELARLRMPNPYSLFCERPPPLVPREHVFGIDERMSAEGETLVAPTADDVMGALEKAKNAGCEIIVVSFLHAWREPRHERSVAQMIAERAPTMPVFCGSEVWPVIREYERSTTAVMNAYVQPSIETYLDRVTAALSDAGVRAPLLLTTSVGGTMTAEAGKRDCVGMLLSGTASGVVGAGLVAKSAGLQSVLTLDIGGTSADVALLEDGEPSFASGLMIGEFPLATSTVAVQSSGQGGGSIVWLDTEGVLQVGPTSAGSTPGPASFGRGGTAMTLTDAAMITGILGHGPIGFGAIIPNRELAELAAVTLASKMGITVEDLAEGALNVAVSGMLVAIEQLLARAGMHASELTLMPFGGAGPMLGALLAEAAGIKQLLVPANPGTLCALGAASAAIRRDTMRTILTPLASGNMLTLISELDALAVEAEAAVVEMVGPGESSLSRMADLRYKGQSFEITVPVGDVFSADDWQERFNESYQRTFGHADPATPVQVVNLRVSCTRPAPDIRFPQSPVHLHSAEPGGNVRLYSRGVWHDARLFERKALAPGARFTGPAIVVQEDSTLLVPEGWHAEIDSFRNIRMKHG